jgi:hypothetical protein
MPRVIITAKVEDTGRWERGFRTHGELLHSMLQSVTHLTTTDDNEVALYSDPDDLAR